MFPSKEKYGLQIKFVLPESSDFVYFIISQAVNNLTIK